MASYPTDNVQCLVPAILLKGGKAYYGSNSTLDDPLTLAGHYGIVGEILIGDSDGANSELVKSMLKVASCRVRVTSVDAAIETLNAGAAKVVISSAMESAEVKQLPRERVVMEVEAADAMEVIKARLEEVGGFLVSFPAKQGTLSGLDLPSIEALAAAVHDKQGAQLSVFGGISTVEDVAALDKLGAEAVVNTALAGGSLDLGRAFAAPMISDRPDGFFSTVVVDEQRRALGLCYSDMESIGEAVKRERGIYRSRKRGLWVKGESSGDVQDLVRVEFDCDRDALRFVVRQHGDGFCHRKDATCFGPASGLAGLMSTLEARKKNAPEGSYTKRLFEDKALLSAKLMEEAAELAEAETVDDVAWEAADVIYFAMVRAVAAGVSFADVERKLDERALKVKRRKGDAKPEFAQKVKEMEAAKASSPSPMAVTKKKPTPSDPVNFPRLTMDSLPSLCPGAVDPKAREIALAILEDVRERGEEALVHHAIRLGDLKEGENHIKTKEDMKAAYDGLPEEQKGVLTRTADRIRAFAQSQRDSISDMTQNIPGGEAGHTVRAVEVAGCYAPGGRYPLPSSVLMTAITARVAGCKEVWVASPRPLPIILAAGHVAGADAMLAVGGAQAIAAMALGAGPVPRCDAVVGPGNRFVTAAKSLVAGSIAMDSLAGPSECLVLADETANPAVVAADLLAQAEHDPSAVPILIAMSDAVAAAVEQEVNKQLQVLPTAETARLACDNGFILVASSIEEAVKACNSVAPEHLEVHTKDSWEVSKLMDHYGGLFVGHEAAEVLGDYGAGPNHTLPTGGTARSFGGLSVFSFLRMRTWIRVDDRAGAQDLVKDAVALAELEGLLGHAAAARCRLD